MNIIIYLKRVKSHSLLLPLLVFSLFYSCENHKTKVLVFSKTAGFRHQSIPDGKGALMKLGSDNAMVVDTTEDASVFSEKNLKKYDVVVFLNTTGNILDFRQQKAFERFIQSGGGYVGIHAASDTEYEWPWYTKLVGGNFESHPHPQQATINILDQNHLATKMLPKTWSRFDEWYNFKNLNPKVTVLATLDEKSYTGGKNGEYHPLIWYHEYDGGRAFYTEPGHTSEAYKEDLFLRHILGAIQYAAGDQNKDYSLCHTKQVPDSSRFVKTTLIEGLEEPYELAISRENDLYFIQRKGGVFKYNVPKHILKQIGTIPVNVKFEDGLLGLTLDPDFSKNGHLYLYYAPTKEVEYRLSRFTFNGDSLLTSSEKIMLRIPSQREACCHTGGSLAFDNKGNLFLSVGDNTTPFESNGYSPLDERPGTVSRDDQRTTANTNDLRGKILRIHPLPDGTYTIPPGNLFDPKDSMAKAEIYIMGDRNPFRLSVDSKTGYLYWGEIGPDAGEDSPRGPKGHDEINQAKKPGFYGWPYFIGDNKAYAMYNFVTSIAGPVQDALKPVNNSINNSGKKELPPAQKAFIWYPYSTSTIFPELKEGGRSAMAGPVYYYEKYKGSEVAFPDYFDHTFFMYEWMRGLILAIKLNDKDSIAGIENHFKALQFVNPMDVEMGPDGSMYVAEYGYKWFSSDKNTKISRVTYERGNRPPAAKITVSDSVGPLQFKVHFSSEGSYDPDDDQIRFAWSFTGDKVNSHQKTPSFTYLNAGVYYPSLKVTDSKGRSTSITSKITVGNHAPVVSIHTEDNQTFYWDGLPLKYKISVEDREEGKINASQMSLSFKYLSEGEDLTAVLGHQQQSSEEKIENYYINKSDCKACHQLKDKSIGPSFYDISLRYKQNKNALKMLSQKIIKGGSGNWGERAMSAHPDLSLADANSMVQYILNLMLNKKRQDIIQSEGEVTFEEHQAEGSSGTYYLSALYTDKGNNGIGPLNGTSYLKLRSAYLKPNACDGVNKVHLWGTDGIAEVKENGGYFYFKNIDLKHVDKVYLQYSASIDSASLDLRLDAPDGKLLGTFLLKKTPTQYTWKVSEIQILKSNGMHTIYFVYHSKIQNSWNMLLTKLFYFNNTNSKTPFQVFNKIK